MIITGSLECHGVHNPLGVDTLVPEALAQRIEKQTEILVLPALPFGSCDYLRGFPGTVSLSTETLRRVLQEIVDSMRAHGARRFLFLNGHGGQSAGAGTGRFEIEQPGRSWNHRQLVADGQRNRSGLGRRPWPAGKKRQRCLRSVRKPSIASAAVNPR